MSSGIWRWSVLGAAFFLLGPLAGWAIGALETPTGAQAAGPLGADSLVAGLGALVLIGACAALVAVIGARRCSLRTGVFGAGLVVAWAGFSGAQVDDVLRFADPPGALWRLAIEGLLLGALGLAIAWLASRAGRAPPDERDTPVRSSGLGVIVALVVGAIGAGAVARSELPGQPVAAAIAAGTFGTVVGRVVDRGLPSWTYVGTIGVLAFAGPAAGAVVHGDRATEALYADSLLAISRLTPLHWLAGALIGVPLGSAWASSMVEKGSEASRAA